MKKQLIVGLLCVILTHCVAAVVAGAATGLVVYDRRTMVMIEQDARIFYLINNAIRADERFKQAHLVITVFNQNVLLVGQIPTASLRILAEKIAQGTPNVRRVYNEITIDAPSALATRSQDAWITGEVRTKLLTKKGLESGSIRVVTENGVVYLMGTVSEEQARLAVNVARKINYVRRVVKVFQYVQFR